jgi:hypothetical protein
MNFINNWQRPIVLPIDAVSAPLDLPDGTFRLTVTDSLSLPTRWEVLTATVATGVASIARGAEATAAQEWPDGSAIYCAITAGVLGDLAQQLASSVSSINALTATVSALASRVSALENPGAFFIQAGADEWVGYSANAGIGAITAGASVYPGVIVQPGDLGEILEIWWSDGDPIYDGVQLRVRCASTEFQTPASLPFSTLKIGQVVFDKADLSSAGYGGGGQVFQWYSVSVNPFALGNNVLTFGA